MTGQMETFCAGLDLFSLIWLLLLAGFAGFVDAVVGGGGLIQVPALFTSFPGMAPATLFGTNKLASICGTALAALRYARRVRFPWRMLVCAFVSTLVFAYLGAKAVSLLPKELVRPIVLALLVLVTISTLVRKDFGHHHAPLHHGKKEVALGVLVGAVLGFYDGFFGPGMGAFLIFCFVRFFGYDFLRASAVSKVLNLSSNLAALSYFIPAGHVLWGVGALMAAANIAGAWVGSHMAIRRGAGFVRSLFLCVLVGLIAKLGVGHLPGLALMFHVKH